MGQVGTAYFSPLVSLRPSASHLYPPESGPGGPLMRQLSFKEDLFGEPCAPGEKGDDRWAMVAQADLFDTRHPVETSSRTKVDTSWFCEVPATWSDLGLVGPLCSAERGFEFGGWDATE